MQSDESVSPPVVPTDRHVEPTLYDAPAPTPYDAPLPTPYGSPAPAPYGSPAPTPYGSAIQDTVPAPPPVKTSGARPSTTTAAGLDPAARKRWTAPATELGCLTVVLGVVGIIVIGLVNAHVNTPQRQVTRYLDALVAGDVSAALAQGNITVPDGSMTLTTDAAFGAATDRVTGYHIDKAPYRTHSSNRPTVYVTLSQGGHDYQETFDLVRDGHTALFFDRWRIASNTLGSIQVTVPSDVTHATVAGVDVPVPNGRISLPAFPGTYEVQVPNVSKYYAAPPTSVTVTGSDHPGVEMAYAPTDALITDITTMLNTKLETCATATVPDPPDCPNVSFAWQHLTGVTWTLDTLPTYDIDAKDADSIAVYTEADGQATIRGTYEDTDPATGAVTVKSYKETVKLWANEQLSVVNDTLIVKS